MATRSAFRLPSLAKKRQSSPAPPAPAPAPVPAATPAASSHASSRGSLLKEKEAAEEEYEDEEDDDGYDAPDEALLNDDEAMAIAVAASTAWFSNPVDGDSIFSGEDMDGRGEEDDDEDAESQYDEAWKAEDPIVLGAREALGTPLLDNEDAGIIPEPEHPAVAPTNAGGLGRKRTTKQGGGILSRLKRISRKEASDAAEQQEKAAHPVVVAAAAAASNTTPQAVTPVEMKRETTTTTTSSSAANLSLMLRDAGIEHVVPMVHEERPSHKRIHSVEPSLVDNESIADRSELNLVMADDDEDDTVLQFDEASSMVIPASPRQLRKSEAAATTTPSTREADSYVRGQHQAEDSAAWSFKDAVSRQASSIYLEEDLPTPTATPKAATASDAKRQSYFEGGVEQAASTSTSTSPVANKAKSTSTSTTSPVIATKTLTATSPSNPKPKPSSPPKSSSPKQQKKKLAAAASARRASQTRKPFPLADGAVADAPQLRHYLLRDLLSRELRHQLARLWMLSDLDDVFKSQDEPQPRRSGGGGGGGGDLACFKLDPHRHAPYLPRTALLRVLARAMLACPLFGPPLPVEGAAAARSRAVGARKFIEEGLLPLARHFQALSLSDTMDRRPHAYVEQSQTMASALKDALLGTVDHFLLASLKATKQDQGWSWSRVKPPPLAAYIGHRLPTNKLRQGGMEIDIVGARTRQGVDADEYLVAVRRFGHPPAYVVRTEADFAKLAVGLAKELGSRKRVRALPGGPNSSSSSSSTLAHSTSTSSLRQQSQNSNVPPSTSTSTITQSTTSSTLYGGGSSKKNSNVSTTSLDTASKTATPKANASLVSVATAREPKKRNSFGLLRSPAQHSSIQSGDDEEEEEEEKKGEENSTTMKSSTSSNRFFSMMNRSASSLASSSGGSTTASNKPNENYSQQERKDMAENRRKQLRAWLRDALSIRGAGHSEEVRQFIGIGAFGEREMRQATRLDMENRAKMDRDNMALRAEAAQSAAEDVLELRDELEALRKSCFASNGFREGYEALRDAPTFSTLPLQYQRAVSWANLRLAYRLHGLFINQAQATSGTNLAKLEAMYNAIPWKMLSVALREPTGLMMAKIKAALTKPSLVDRMVALVVGEESTKEEQERQIAELQRRLGSALSRKLYDFVHSSSDHKKRLIRDAARRADIPLVCAIARGSDKPLLASQGVKRIVAATRTYKDFYAAKPTPEEVRAKQRANVDVRLITDMQALLRLQSAKRDGAQLRAALKDAAVRKPMEAILEPVWNLVRRLHKSRVVQQGSSGVTSTEAEAVLKGLQSFLLSLMDVLAGLRVRVQDPWRSIATLSLFLDDAVPSWYAILHRWVGNNNSTTTEKQNLTGRMVQDLFQWLATLGSLRLGDDDTEGDKDPLQEACQRAASVEDSKSIEALARHLARQHFRRRTRQMEAAARWAAGDMDADHAIQLQGADAGKTRTKPFVLDEEPTSHNMTMPNAELLAVEDNLARSFGEAL